MPVVTAPSLKVRKQQGDKIAMLTAYDYPSAKILDESGIDAILVGDSCSNVILGRENTLSMTMDEMLHHVKMVSRACSRALVIADMPFMSYQVSVEDAIRNAGRLIQEGGAHCVKLEGPPSIFAHHIRGILNASIPVIGHLGLTPQSVHQLGGYKVQGKDADSKQTILQAAIGLDQLGCSAVVLECVPPELAWEVSQSISIPTIGIGAGAGCDGQILVMHDMMGWGHTKFTKTFVDVRGAMMRAVSEYVSEVKDGAFPAVEHTYQCKS